MMMIRQILKMMSTENQVSFGNFDKQLSDRIIFSIATSLMEEFHSATLERSTLV